ncbi:hypothetical protein D3C76_521330 [compost metagenome]
MSTDCVRLVPGTRRACRAKSPSLRLGMNSLPMRLAITPDNSTSTAAALNASLRRPSTQPSTGA